MESSEEGELKYTQDINLTKNIFEYQLGPKIGEGTFGKVYLAKYKGSEYALKKIPMDGPNGISITTIREIKILKTLSHDNIIKIIDISCKTQPGVKFDRKKCELFIVFPYLKYDLYSLNRNRQFSLQEIKHISKQIAEGLKYLHGKNYIHRDLKSANILLNENLDVKICDFGLARHFVDASLTPGVVTLWYRAPELILGSDKYDKSIDVWALGCIFGEMALKEPILMGQSEIEQLELIVHMCGSINEKTFVGVEKLCNYKKIKISQGVNKICKIFENTDKKYLNLIYKMLVVDPKKRIKISEVVDHEYFQDIEENVKRQKTK